MKYVDIHSHLNLPEFETDLSLVIARLKNTQTGTIIVGTDFETSKKAVEIAEVHDNIYACIGVHPVDNPTRIFEKEKFKALACSPKVVAIGECGLDFFHADKDADFVRQEQLFRDQIELALEFDLPLMIHSRSAEKEVVSFLEPLVKEHGSKLRGNVHFFAGDLNTAKRFWEINFTTSFTGVITFTHDYDEVIKAAPLEMLMSETDAPYVSPVPYRGKRNEPSYVSEVVKKIAEIRGEDLVTVERTLAENASRVFGINLA